MVRPKPWPDSHHFSSSSQEMLHGKMLLHNVSGPTKPRAGTEGPGNAPEMPTHGRSECTQRTTSFKLKADRPPQPSTGEGTTEADWSRFMDKRSRCKRSALQGAPDQPTKKKAYANCMIKPPKIKAVINPKTVHLWPSQSVAAVHKVYTALKVHSVDSTVIVFFLLSIF